MISFCSNFSLVGEHFDETLVFKVRIQCDRTKMLEYSDRWGLWNCKRFLGAHYLSQRMMLSGKLVTCKIMFWTMFDLRLRRGPSCLAVQAHRQTRPFCFELCPILTWWLMAHCLLASWHVQAECHRNCTLGCLWPPPRHLRQPPQRQHVWSF